MSVLVDFSIEEAEALLTALSVIGGGHKANDPNLVSGCERLEQAVRVERGPGGNVAQLPNLADRVEELLGQYVQVNFKDGRSDKGKMRKPTGSVLYIQVSATGVRGIPLSRVLSIEPVDVAA